MKKEIRIMSMAVMSALGIVAAFYVGEFILSFRTLEGQTSSGNACAGGQACVNGVCPCSDAPPGGSLEPTAQCPNPGNYCTDAGICMMGCTSEGSGDGGATGGGETTGGTTGGTTAGDTGGVTGGTTAGTTGGTTGGETGGVTGGATGGAGGSSAGNQSSATNPSSSGNPSSPNNPSSSPNNPSSGSSKFPQSQSSTSFGACSSMPTLPDAICANSVDFFVYGMRQHATFLRCQAEAQEQHLECNNCEYRSYMDNVPLLMECIGECGTPLYDQLYEGKTCVSAEQQKACYDSCHASQVNCANHPPTDMTIAQKKRYAAQCADKAATCFSTCPVYCPVCLNNNSSSSRSGASSQLSVSSRVSSLSSASRSSVSVRSSQSSVSSRESSISSVSQSSVLVRSSQSSQSTVSSQSSDGWRYVTCSGYSGDDLSNCAFSGESCPGDGVFTGQTCKKERYQNGELVSQETGLCCTRGQSSSSSSVYPPSGVCCETGNCNPFGTCSNPFQNFNACTQACGAGSSSVQSQSSISAQSSASQQSSSATTQSFNSAQSSLFTQGSSAPMASSASSYSNVFLNNSSVPFVVFQNSSNLSLSCTDNYQCPSGLCTDGVCQPIPLALSCIDNSQCASNQCINGMCRASSTGDSACFADADCQAGERCILNRCLTVHEVAQLPSFCGNARTDAGEICDDGVGNSDTPNASCRTNCIPARCGDGVIDTPLEQCDDGNNSGNDGCSAFCLPERNAPTTQTLPAQVIELPFANKGDLGSNTDDQISDIRYPSSVNGQLSTENGKLPSVPSTPDTGPAALAVMIAGGAAGWLYRRRR